jgi:integrase
MPGGCVRWLFSLALDRATKEHTSDNWIPARKALARIVIKKETDEVMSHLANSLTIKPQMRMLFILCGASGLRIGEAWGIRVEKIRDGGTRIIIYENEWHGEIHDYLKTENGERETDLPENVAKLLIEFIGDPKSGPLFCTRNGKQLSQSNILRRHLDPALAAVGFEKAGNHVFRRFRDTFLKNHTNCPEGVLRFWLGRGSEGMWGHYDRIKNDVAFRKDVANRCGVGFDVQVSLASIEPNEPKPEAMVEQEVAVTV